MEHNIPPKTLAEIQSPGVVGDRHAQMIRIAIPLVGNGIPDDAIFSILRSKYDADKTDKEILDVISHARSVNPQPTVYGAGKSASFSTPSAVTPLKENKNLTADDMVRNATTFIRGFNCTECDIREISPIGSVCSEVIAILMELYKPDEYINLVSKFTVSVKADGTKKANPSGSGTTKSRYEWLSLFSKAAASGRGIPSTEAGGWMRFNPVKPIGSGKEGAIKDCDVTSFRFVLMESDILPPELQLPVLAKLKLPIALILKSGGNSYHAWVKVDAKDDDEYTQISEKLFSLYAGIGIDRANKNPSRLSRLAGAKRTIGAHGDGMQSLIYLNPNPKTEAIL